MAEIVGTVASAVTLAALFKLCVEAFDVIHTAQNQAVDLKKLTLKLNIEKCRLYTWGQAMGLTSISETRKRKSIDLCPFPELVQETLDYILDIFKDSQKLKDKYGCIRIDNIDEATLIKDGSPGGVLQQLNASFDNFRIKSTLHAKQTPIAKKTRWVVRDRKKFEALIHEAKDFIDSLQDITKDLQSQAVQHQMISSRILEINDVRTLDWVSEVCEVDYPAFSDAASLKAETITEFSSFHHDIQNWKDAIGLEDKDDGFNAPSVETVIAGLEDLTVTELKHKLSTYLLRAREARLQIESSPSKDFSTASSPSALGTNDTDNPTGNVIDREQRVEVHKDCIYAPPATMAEATIIENIEKPMNQARTDEDFDAELIAMVEWFSVLTDAQRNAALYSLGEQLSKDFYSTRFFALVQNRRLESLKLQEISM